MKYLCLIYKSEAAGPADAEAPHDEECATHLDALRASGHLLGAEPLQPVSTATTVRKRDGRVSVTDGPFAETKEHLVGFILIEARDLNDAIRVASTVPTARTGCVEVRPVRELAPGLAAA